jgi:hypothetical protein
MRQFNLPTSYLSILHDFDFGIQHHAIILRNILQNHIFNEMKQM